jgi:hypothetical protein
MGISILTHQVTVLKQSRTAQGLRIPTSPQIRISHC